MVKTSVGATVLLFVVYSIFIGHLKPYWSRSQHQWQENLIKAEHFIYDKYEEKVLVGSSLSNRLQDVEGVSNLAMSGQSIFDGLNVVFQANHSIKAVVIEINVVNRPEDISFHEYVSNPVLFEPKKIFKSLRADKQPLAFLSERVEWIIRSRGKKAINSDSTKNIKHEKELFEDILKLHSKNYSKRYDRDQLMDALYLLKEKVSVLEKKGVKIIFFEMPVDYRLCNLPLTNDIRNGFYQLFPVDKYSYIPLPDCSNFSTTDGIHLDRKSARDYTKYFIKKLDSLKI